MSVLGIALEMTRKSLGLTDDLADGSLPSTSSNLRRPASGIRIFYV